jgi:hypothetical protein
VVNRVRRAFDAQKAGHGGTLDPLATGVLPIAFGAATKTVPYVMDGTKLYRFTLRFGSSGRVGCSVRGAAPASTSIRSRRFLVTAATLFSGVLFLNKQMLHLPHEHIYPVHARTRKTFGSMIRKLSVT